MLGGLVRACVFAVVVVCVGSGLAYPQTAKAEALWSVPSARGAIEGYLSKISVVPGQTVEVRINVPSADTYRLRVFRLDGSTLGGTEVGCRPTCGVDRRGIAQPAATTDPVTNEIRAPWTTTDTLRVGTRWPSGYYAVQFVLTSGPQAGSGAWAPLIVKRAPQRQPAKILLEIPMSTAAAYNEWGGLSAYSGGPWSEVVSLDRPFLNGLLGGEYGLLRFLMRNGFEFDVQTDLDTAADPTSLLRYDLVLVGGHDEYWTQRTSDAFYAAKAKGVNLAFFGSNIGYWRTRLENGGRSIVIYKHGPRDPLGVTGYYRDTHPECHLLGVQHQGGALNWLPGPFTVDPAGAAHKWLRGTGLKAGDELPGLVSVEVDTVPNSFAVVGKTCPSPPVTVLLHREMGGDTLGNADAVTYVARSGARIFSAGSLDFVNGIDDISARTSGGPSFVDRRVQKFVLNMLRGMTGQR